MCSATKRPTARRGTATPRRRAGASAALHIAARGVLDRLQKGAFGGGAALAAVAGDLHWADLGLTAGEPPTVRAYTPNVFAELPRIVERCGAVASGGAITSVMTVLSETDDVDDPIVETMKSLLDGHIVLSRTLAERGHFPAIDVSRSISRLAASLMTVEHASAARDAITALGTYNEARMLIDSGVYKPGTNPALDRAIARREALLPVLQQGQTEHVPFGAGIAALQRAMTGDRRHA